MSFIVRGALRRVLPGICSGASFGWVPLWKKLLLVGSRVYSGNTPVGSRVYLCSVLRTLGSRTFTNKASHFLLVFADSGMSVIYRVVYLSSVWFRRCLQIYWDQLFVKTVGFDTWMNILNNSRIRLLNVSIKSQV